MNISDIITKCYILALIIRDDGERILLGDGFYEFTEQLQHFQPNTFQNDVIELQGTDGQLLAGQVRRGATQSFDGYIADATASREATEEHRQRFLGFFRKKHHYKVVYVFPDGSAIKRERGYIVDAPSVPEMFQRFPEFHVGLNFEDVNYYEYEEGEDGEEIFAHVQNIAIAANAEGGLIWDAFGAVSNEKTWLDWENGITVNGLYTFNNGLAGAPLEFTQLDGNTTQETLSGKNLLCNELKATPPTIGGVSFTIEDGVIKINGTTTSAGAYIFQTFRVPSGQATFSVSFTGTIPNWTNSFLVEQNDSDASTGWQTVGQVAPPGTTASLTLDSTKYYRFRWYINASGVQDQNCQIKAQLELGSTATDFEPYCGGVPSPNPDYPQPVEVVSGGQIVQVAGKNLFNFAEFAEAKTQPGGVSRGTATVSGSSITITATAYDAFTTYSFTQDLPPIFKVPKNTEMVLSWVSDNTTVNQKGMVYIFGMNESGGVDVIRNAQDRVNRAQFNTGKYDTISFRLGVTAIGDSITYSNIQLEYGMTPSEYEPYKGTQSIEVNMGKNLVNISDLADTNITVLDGVASGTGTQFYASYGQNTDGVPFIKKNGQLAISFKAYTDGNVAIENTNGLVCRVVYTDGTNGIYVYCKNNETTAVRHTATTTAGKDVESIQFTYANVGGNTWHISELQIESSILPTSYAPFFTPIELAKIPGTNYKDAFKRIDGVWFKHAEIGKVVLTGTMGGYNGVSEWFYIGYSNLGIGEGVLDGGVRSDYFTMDAYNHMSANPTIDGLIATSGTHIVLRNLACTDAATYKTWLSTHNTTIYYALATPTDTQITEPELLAQLNAIASTFDGVNNITITPAAGAQGELSVHYATGSIDVGAGYEWDAAQGGGPNILDVDGIDRTGFVWEVVGPATNPTLTNITTNQTMTFEGDVATGQTLIVNTSDQTAEIAGTNVFAQMEGDWMQLAPGNNVIAYTATGATEPSKIKWNGVVG